MLNVLIIILLLIIIPLITKFYYNYKVKRVNRVRDYVKNGDKILDLGSGKSCLKKNLRKDVEVISIDVKDFGKCDHPIIYDGKNIPLADKSVDVSVCSFVLHHTNNQIQILNELKRVTKRLVIIMEDIPENSFDRYLTIQHSKSHWGTCAECFKTETEWIDILEKYFKVDKVIIPRFEFPFSQKPLIYPIKRICFYCYVI